MKDNVGSYLSDWRREDLCGGRGHLADVVSEALFLQHAVGLRLGRVVHHRRLVAACCGAGRMADVSV